MDFGTALVALKSGQCVGRLGWNGKGMFLFLVPRWDFFQHSGLLQADGMPSPLYPTRYPWPLGLPDAIEKMERLPFIAMKTATDQLVPWLASQTDVLAEDWESVIDGPA